MNTLTTSLFASSEPKTIGVGYHNVGRGCLRASHLSLVQKIQNRYGQRCGHLPLEAERVYVLVTGLTAEVESQWAYLSHLMGKTITVLSLQDLAVVLRDAASTALIVPYINVPQTEHWLQEELGASSWGLAGKMVQFLKNKADLHRLVEDLQLEGVAVPEYTIAPVAAVPQAAQSFLSAMEEITSQAGMDYYPRGIMLRAAESDGHYGSCLVYEHQQRILIIPDGDMQRVQRSLTWEHAFILAQKHLMASMDQQQANRVVMSRFVVVADSPGLSVVILDGQIESLGWNSQLQTPGSTACVGTSSYQPKNAAPARLQQVIEEQTVACFEVLLKEVAYRCGLDFPSLRGVANLDFMLPGPLEQELQRRRGLSPTIYLAECNPRWTNYTDALLTILAVKQQPPTVSTLRTTIQEGLATIDCYPLPPTVEPERLRDELLRRDMAFRQAGMSIICRMTQNPMGFIFAGNVKQAQQEIVRLLKQLSTTTIWAREGKAFAEAAGRGR